MKATLCQLCRRPTNGTVFCPARVAPDCYAIAREHLGIPKHVCRQLRAREWRTLIEARKAKRAA
jgi:hypothetical protein